MDILARCKQMEAQGIDVVHMEIGQPDFPSPQPIINAGIEALKNDQTHYSPALGLKELRERISEYYRSRMHAIVAAEQIVITPGASGALQLIFAHLLGSGKEIMVSDPGYPCNLNLAKLFGEGATSVPVDAETNFQLDTELIERHWHENIAAVMIASPSNPTGTICDAQQLLEIADWLAVKDCTLIVDEIYQGLCYGRQSETVAGQRDNIFVLNSFSKYFGMTGWRVGWIVSPDCHMQALDAVAQNTYLAASTIAQYAALAAFSAETRAILEQRRDIFMHRRDMLCDSLQTMGIKVPVIPQGAFYVYANVSGFTNDSFTFCKDLLESKAVAITPGCDFGEHRANEFVRLAYTTSEERLRTGMRRLQEFISSL